MSQQAATKTVVIHCGHSVGYDSGATSSYISEAELNQILGGKLFRELDRRGYKVYITHTTDDSLAPYKLMSNQAADTLRNVGPVVNSVHPDLAFSIHHNSGGRSSSGTELYWSSYRDYDGEGVYTVPGLWADGSNAKRDSSPCENAQQSLRLAQVVRDNFQGFPNLPFRNIFERDDYLPAHAQCPCILYEGGYLSNPSEAAYMSTAAYQDEAARRLADSVDAFFGGPPNRGSIRITTSKRTMPLNGSMSLGLAVEPQDANYTIQWSSDNPDIVSVDQSGNVRAVNYGSTTIRAVVADDPELTSSIVLSVQPPGSININYETHIQDYGWRGPYINGETGGTTGESRQMEAIKIQLTNENGDQIDPNELSVKYRTHVANQGWKDYTFDNAVSGTEGQGLQMEAVQMNFEGSKKNDYDIFYRTHVQNYGWTGWSANGAPSGSEGMALRVEAVEIKFLPKGSAGAPNTQEGIAFYTAYGPGEVRYAAHSQSVGWMDYVYDGQVAGTEGRGLRLEALKLYSNPNLPPGSVECSAHVQDYGWMDYTNAPGTVGESKRMEAVKLRLTGELGQKFDVHYQALVQNHGWSQEMTNEQVCGTTGQSLRIEAVKIWLTLKEDNQAEGDQSQDHVDTEGQV